MTLQETRVAERMLKNWLTSASRYTVEHGGRKRGWALSVRVSDRGGYETAKILYDFVDAEQLRESLLRTEDEYREVHYTTLGWSAQPPEADVLGYLQYRVYFRDLDRSEWTGQELAIAEQEDAITGNDPVDW